MEALDIMDGGAIPLFHYGQSYGGGHTVEALMALPWFLFFGPADFFVKLGPAMLACLHVALVYLTLYRFFNKRFALIAATLFSFFATFVAANFYANGGMITLLLGWLGLHFFFYSYFAQKENLFFIIFSGAAIGFAYYTFDYALYYLVVVISLWVLKEKIHLWRQWKCLLSWVFGYFVGAAPLVYFNLTQDFANFKNLLSQAVEPTSLSVLNTLERFAVLIYQDLPAFFSLDIDDFAQETSPVSFVSYALFMLAVIYTLVNMARPIRSLIQSFFTGKRMVLASHDRIVYILLVMFLYLAIYSMSSAGGKAARYLIPLSPLIPILLAWPVHHLGRSHPFPALLFACLFAVIQVYFLVQLARDKTTVEWRIVTHGEDIKTLARFLLDNNLTTVVTPYEIKWKLMFESRRKIVAAAYLFGFDREHEYNMEVIDRVNRRGIPLAMVFDKDLKLPRITFEFNPQAGFDVDGFHDFLRQSQITYHSTPVGQSYIVYHDFSKPFSLPDPYGRAASTSP